MLCEDCKKNQATVIITVTAGSEITTRHLCQECTKKMEMSFVHGDVQNFLTSLLAILSAVPEGSALSCSGCGLNYSAFQQTGRLGCAQCYQDFSAELRPLLARIQGRSQHAGRNPEGYSRENTKRQTIDDLRKRMDKAVSVENFEEAAQLRDEIRLLCERADTEGS